MPKIFTTDKKRMLNELLKQNCIILMKDSGYKGFNIRDLTKITGISAGTFYNFYHSREDIILEIMKDCQDKLNHQFIKIHKAKGGIDRKEFVDLYYTFFVEDKNNIFQYLSRDDLTSLLLRTDKKLSFKSVKNIMIQNVRFLNHHKENINLNAVINFTQLVNLCIENRDLLVAKELTNTIKKLLENAADEIFEEEI